jgi:SAM-dependent methyltransferase
LSNPAEKRRNEHKSDGGKRSRKKLLSINPSEAWPLRAEAYRDLILDPEQHSRFLRESGLLPNILDMVRPCGHATLLDAGTGTGWLFDYIKPKKAHACDLVRPTNVPSHVEFRQEDVNALSYQDGMFDIIVASLLLIYCKDLMAVCQEFRRVAKRRGAKLVISLMHPYFYRTGEVTKDGNFVITQDLSQPMSFTLKIAEKVGPFEYFYRPLPDYFNALIKAGWTIARVKDWFIDMSRYPEGLMTDVRRSGSIPLFTFLDCRTF